jgi:hypothetical protein
MADDHQFWFRSDLFRLDPKEDEQTNSQCYGRELAAWIKTRFTELGYVPEDVIAEDWGWCVMLDRSAGLLWIGCGNVQSDLRETSKEELAAFIPVGAARTWTVFVGTGKPIWSLRFAKRREEIRKLKEQTGKAASDLKAVLRAERRILLVPEE